jgi:DNA repair protein RadA/Sms
VAVGEVGLGGEIRMISQIEKRIAEARKLGFRRMLLPKNNMKGLRKHGEIEIREVGTVEEAIGLLVDAG